MPLTIRAHSGGGRGVIRMEDVPDDADAERIKFLLERTPSAPAIGFAMGTWDVFLCNAAGAKLEPHAALADGDAIAPRAPGSTVNVWVEPKPGAAGELWGPGC